jgi:hypothetical protein
MSQGDASPSHRFTAPTWMLAATGVLARAAGATEGELQHLMTRVTGNYKRGNERRA